MIPQVVSNLIVATLAMSSGPLRVDSLDILAHYHLQHGNYQEASKHFSRLAQQTTGRRAFRYKTLSHLLTSHPDGQYQLKQPYPATATLWGKQSIQPGVMSLSDHRVLQAALHDTAMRLVNNAQDQMDTVRADHRHKPGLALTTLGIAKSNLDHANALDAGVANCYRQEWTQLTTWTHQAKADQLASLFDTDLKQFRTLPPNSQTYQSRLTALRATLRQLRRHLQSAVAHAQKYPNILSAEMYRAKENLKTLQPLMKLLREKSGGKA